MDRESLEIKLPSGKIAKIKAYLTRGEREAIDASKLAGGKMKMIDGEVVIEDLPTNFLQNYDNQKLKSIVVSIDDDDANIATINELRTTDADVLMEAVNKVFLGEEASKKKSSNGAKQLKNT